MMRSRLTGCLCLDCSGGWCKDRAQEKREVRAMIIEDLIEDCAERILG